MFEWEESTFLGLKALYQRVVTRPQERRASTVRTYLKEHRQRLFLLAQMAAGKPVTLFETGERTLCDDECIFLPPDFAHANTTDANLAFLELKTLLGGLVIRHDWVRDRLTPLSDRVPELGEDFPRLPALIDKTIADFESPESFWFFIGEVRPQSLGTSEESATVSGPDDDKTDAEPGDETTEIQGKGQLDVTVEPEREDDGAGSELPVHTFEKAETLEEHTGLSRKNDDEDELKDHEEALNQLDMTHVLRSRDRPTSIYRADILLE
jgi:nitric oxide reductase NorD protein